MARKILDLSHTLTPLTKELQDTVRVLCNTEQSSSSLLGTSIDCFIAKYGASSFQSLDDLLNASVMSTQYLPTTNLPLNDLLEDLIAK